MAVDKRAVDTDPTDPVWEGMPLRTFERIGRHIVNLLPLLGLSDWKINLMHQPTTEDEAAGEIQVVAGRRVANLLLAHDFATMPPADQQHFLVHELVHVHLYPLHSMLEDVMPKLVGEATWLVIELAQHEREEHAVDALAAVLAPLLPMIPSR